MARKKKKGASFSTQNPSIPYKNYLLTKSSLSLEEAIGLVQSIRRDCRNQLVANHVVIELLTVNIFRAAFDDILFGNDLDVDNFGLSISNRSPGPY